MFLWSRVKIVFKTSVKMPLHSKDQLSPKVVKYTVTTQLKLQWLLSFNVIFSPNYLVVTSIKYCKA